MRFPWVGLLATGMVAVSFLSPAIATPRISRSNDVRYAVSSGDYEIVDLGMLPGYQQNYPAAVNDRDAVVSSLCCNAAPFPFDSGAALYQAGHLSALGFLPGFPGSNVNAINATGLAVGSVSQAAPTGSAFPDHTQAVVFDRWGIHVLRALPGHTESVAMGVNRAGDIIGYSQSPSDVGVTLFRHGQTIRLGDGWGYGINNRGLAIGTGRDGIATVYSIDGTRELGALRGTNAYSYGEAINDRGVAVGYSGYPISQWPNTFQHAFVADSGGMRDLGVPANDDFTATQVTAYAINDLDEIVGYDVPVAPGTIGFGAPSAFIYTNGVMRDLNSFAPSGSGWTLVAAQSINNCGDIVGQGTRNRVAHAYLLRRRHPDRPALRTALGCRR